MPLSQSKLTLPLIASICLVMVACGGGGSSSSSLGISGVAATGAAISAGSVELVCAVGTATGTTQSDGSYSLTIPGGSLPCVARVTDGANVYHSVIPDTGSSTATANITPLTELVVASLAGTTPSAFYTNFASKTATEKSNSVTSSMATTAQTAVKTTLATNLGITVTDDLLSGSLVPGSSSSTYDVALETVAKKLDTTDSSLNALTTSVVTTSSNYSASSNLATAVTASSSAYLPSDMLLKPKASTCSALRSYTYRVISPYAGASSVEDLHQKVTFDAEKLTLTYSDNTSDTFTPDSTTACQFTSASGKSTLVVSQAGVVVARVYNSSSNASYLALALPEQTHTLAELEGTWNFLGMEYPSSSIYTGTTATATLNASGTFTGGYEQCIDQTAGSIVMTGCVQTLTTLNGPTVAVNKTGGFDLTASGASTPTGRAFVYKSGAGTLMAAYVWADGSFSIMSKQRTNSLPVVGESSSNWQISVDNTLKSVNSVGTYKTQITSVADSASSTSSYVRTNQTVSGTGLHSETLKANTPRAGYTQRTAGTDNGQSFFDSTTLNLKGMGLNAVLIQSRTTSANRRFLFTVIQP